MTSEQQRVLAIQSHVVSGYVGNKCAVFPLQVLGFEVDFVNSVQFSNHTGYGNWKGQVLNEADLDDLYTGLKGNDLVKYNGLLTGYVGSESFLRQICKVVKDVKRSNPDCVYLCDPVLGDDGHFYVPKSLVPIYANEVLPLADIITPNTFEMEHLTGVKMEKEEDALEATRICHSKGVPNVVLTSLDSSSSCDDMYAYVSFIIESTRHVWRVKFPKVEGKFTGSGDLFAALFLGAYLKKKDDIPSAITQTLSTMGKVLKRTKAWGETNRGRPGVPTELRLVQSLDDIRSMTTELQAEKILEAPFESS